MLHPVLQHKNAVVSPQVKRVQIIIRKLPPVYVHGMVPLASVRLSTIVHKLLKWPCADSKPTDANGAVYSTLVSLKRAPHIQVKQLVHSSIHPIHQEI